MSSRDPSAPELRAGPREWFGLAVLALPVLLLALDNNVLFLALPHLSVDLAPSSTQLLWISDVYGFMVAGSLVTMGTLGDRIGRRKLLLIGATAFGLASAAAAYASSPEMLIITRALLGVAGATLMPSTLALISNMFRDRRQRGVAIAVWSSCFLAGGAGGPVVGGLLLEHFWWGSVFLLGVPVMVLLLVTAPVLLPEHRAPDAGKMDLPSVALSLATILPVVYGLKELAAYGLGVLPILTIVTGAACGAMFVRRQRQLTAPLLDLRLFSSRSFSAALGVLLLVTFVMGGALLLVTQYLQLVEGLSPLQAGLWLLPPTLGLITGNLLAPHLAQHIRPASIVTAALLIAAIGLGLLTQVGSDDGLSLLIVAYSVVGVGLSPLVVLGTNLVLASAPPEQAGAASSTSETAGELGIALGVATLGSLGTAVYRSQTTTFPTGIPAEVAEAARDTLAGAMAAAESLPSGLATAVLEPAREAFTSGLNVVAGVSAAITVVFAVLATAVLRPISTTTEAVDTAASREAADGRH